MFVPSTLTRFVQVSLAMLSLSFIAAPARAQCDNPKTDEQRAQCLGDELRGSDRTINRVYGELMKSLSPEDRTKLREDQRAWIKQRDLSCAITWSKGDREAWLKDLLRDYQKTVCVVRLTGQRVDQLNQYQTSNAVAPPDSPVSPSRASDSAPVYDIATREPKTRGKWYFEVKIDYNAIRQQAETALFVGVVQALPEAEAANASGNSYGSLATIRRVDKDRDPVTVGFALDLDNGKLYESANGTWTGGAPGSSGGLDLLRGRSYKGWITSSVALNGILKSQAFDVNCGDRAFVYHTPDGYSPFQHRDVAISSGGSKCR
jgi:uncharacterized protein YecT (DUF1311 family)